MKYAKVHKKIPRCHFFLTSGNLRIIPEGLPSQSLLSVYDADTGIRLAICLAALQVIY